MDNTKTQVKAIILMYYDDIRWHVTREGQEPLTGSMPLVSTNGDYMALLSNVVNAVNDSYQITDWEFRRGSK